MSWLRALRSWFDEPALTRHPRYRAWERRGTLAAVRAGAVTVAIVQVADGILLADEAPQLLVVNLPIAFVALSLLRVMRQDGSARRRPIAGIFLLGGLALTATVLPIILIPQLAGRMVGYLPMLVVASALFVPWSGRWHGPWLAAALVTIAAFDASPLVAPLVSSGVGGLFPITFAAAVTSLAGHAVLQRERRRAFAHRMQIRRLNHAARHQRREVAALAAQLEAVARRDPLTGIGNRLRLEEELGALRPSAAGDRAAAEGCAAAVMLDIDGFKAYNEEHGHLAGDRALREVARTIAINVRPGDLVYRFGGDEFLVLLLDTDFEGAQVAAERIRRAVAELDTPNRGNRPWGVLTVSAGIASVPIGDPLADTWIREADERLCRSKAAGRNRVTGPLDAVAGRTGVVSAA